MNKTLKLILRIVLWIAAGLALLYAAQLAFLSIRYSPGYMVNEVFKDMGTVYDWRILPSNPLNASSNPSPFAEDKSREAQVQEAFQTNPQVAGLDAFLEGAGTQAFLVIQDRTLIYERYFMGYQRDSIVTSYSIAKSFDSAMIGIAIQEGYIHSADDPITDYIPELLERDPRFGQITIRHLLMMSSGMRYEEGKPFGTGDDTLTYEFDDLRHLALTETEVVEAPGVSFVYNNYNPMLLGMILERAAGMPVTAYLQQKLWTPLGMEYDGSWSRNSEKSDFEKMESGINAPAIDFAKLGQFYLDGGSWNGSQIVPADWVAQSTADSGLIQDAPIDYGYMWWGKDCTPGSHDFFAYGNFGQFIYVSPAKNLVIVRFGEKYGLEGEMVEWTNIFCQAAQAMP